MKTVMRRTAALAICLMLVLGMNACGKKADETVNLTVGQTYRFTEIPFYEFDLDWDFVSEDTKIAEVIGQDIVAREPGKTRITVKMGENVKTYDVSVESGEDDRVLSGDNVKEVMDTYAYLGAGYNAFNATGLLTEANVITSRQMITGSMIEKNKYTITASSSIIDQFIQIQGDSAESYEEDYNRQIKGLLEVDLKGIVGVGVSGKYEEAKKKTSEKNNAFNTIMMCTQRLSYSLALDKVQIANEIKTKNPTAWKALTGEDGSTAAEFFEAYGTHMIVGALLGGRLEIDYMMTSTNDQLSSSELLKISGQLNAKISGVKLSGEAEYGTEEKLAEAMKNTYTKTTVKVCGGVPCNIKSPEEYPEKEKIWYNSITKENSALIGANQLVPMSELLDKNDPKQRERIKELDDEYNRRINGK
ncbi:MAG: hypothetical protein K6G60_06190 [Lachnospiraceae bacterium]|nr:hypothetical protein [Lachnospiraceae bacterium]